MPFEESIQKKKGGDGFFLLLFLSTSSSHLPPSPKQKKNTQAFVEEAADYDAVNNVWRNRMSSGVAVSLARGDFVATGGADTFPTKTTVGGVPALVFNASAAAGGAQYLTGNATWTAFNGIYGGSDWTLEAWVYSMGYMTGNNIAESPVFQVRSGWLRPVGHECNARICVPRCVSGWVHQSAAFGASPTQV